MDDDEELFLHVILHSPLFRESLDKKLSHQRYMRCIFYCALSFQLFMFLLFCYGNTSYADAVHCLSIMTSVLCHSVYLYLRHCTLFFTRWLLIREENTVWLCQQKEKFTHGEKVMMGNWGMATEGIFYTPDVASVWSAAVSLDVQCDYLLRNYNVLLKIKSIHKG